MTRVARRRPDELRCLRRAGRVVAEMHDAVRAALRPGVTTAQLDRVAREVLERRGAGSNFLGYHGFPAVMCASPNEVVLHGIPDDRPLRDGDVVSIDCGAVVDGYHGDAAFTAAVGTADVGTRRLIDVTEAALEAGIATLASADRLGDVGWAIQSTVQAAGYTVVEGYVGHGIGTAMHEPPDVPNTGRPGRGHRVRVGNVLALEPMACTGRPRTEVAEDGWTVSTADGSPSAHWEHTVAITDEGPEVLTRG